MTKTQDAERSPMSGLTTPLVSVAIGIAYLVAGWAGGNLEFGLFGLALMTGLAVVLVLVRRRSETVKGLLDRRDERINTIDLRATAFAGVLLIVTVVGGFVVEIARGQDGAPFYWLGAIAGVAYIGAVIVLRLRG
jgi:prepilin signal peptidase PulO-like enzyme (type II secretory pathway)